MPRNRHVSVFGAPSQSALFMRSGCEHAAADAARNAGRQIRGLAWGWRWIVRSYDPIYGDSVGGSAPGTAGHAACGEKPPKAQTSSSRFCSLKDASCAWARVATDSDPSWLTITAFRGRHRADLRIHGS